MTVQNIPITALPEHVSPESRIWMYQADRTLTIQESQLIQEKLNAYVQDWKAHGKPIEGYAKIYLNRFILLLADESRHQVSGCSIDTSVRMLKEIENELQINLFDRQTLCFWKEEKIETIGLSELEKAIESGRLTPDTIYFNQTVQTKKEFEVNWLIPLKNSWLKRYLPH